MPGPCHSCSTFPSKRELSHLTGKSLTLRQFIKKCAPSNYRPISLTSVVVKTFERIIHNAFLSKNNLLSPSQHGFRPNHSCQTQLLEATKDWFTTLHNKARVHIIFLDFSKAFDTIPHETPFTRQLIRVESGLNTGQIFLSSGLCKTTTNCICANSGLIESYRLTLG